MSAKQNVIEINNLSIKFGEKEALKKINLSVSKGEIIGYIGSNGAGKSTTIKILLGLIKGYQGEVKIFDENIENTNIDLKQKIGYVPEVVKIYESLTAREYLTFIGQIYKIEYEQY